MEGRLTEQADHETEHQQIHRNRHRMVRKEPLGIAHRFSPVVGSRQRAQCFSANTCAIEPCWLRSIVATG